LVEQVLRHRLGPLAVQRPDQRQSENFVPELDHRSRKLEQLLCLALDDVIAALLVDCIESETVETLRDRPGLTS
jgi:hypothetical protein